MDWKGLPCGYHIVVHLLQLLLRGIHGVWRWVQLIGLEALIGETDLERLVILLNAIASPSAKAPSNPSPNSSQSHSHLTQSMRNHTYRRHILLVRMSRCRISSNSACRNDSSRESCLWQRRHPACPQCS